MVLQGLGGECHNDVAMFRWTLNGVTKVKSHVGDYRGTRCVLGFAGGWKPKVCVVLGLREICCEYKQNPILEVQKNISTI